MCTTEGKLMGLTYDQSEQVKAWHEHDVDGKVRSMTVIPDPNTSSDMLFIAVEREGGVLQSWNEPYHQHHVRAMLLLALTGRMLSPSIYPLWYTSI
jgi:hypothetical protein